MADGNAAPPARAQIDAAAAYQALKVLFPAVSRKYLRANSRFGLERMSNHLLDHEGHPGIPETKGDDTDDEEEREERRQQAAAWAIPREEPNLDPFVSPPNLRRREQQQGGAEDENADAVTPPRKQIRVAQPAARPLQQQQPVQQVAAAVVLPPQQAPAVAAAAGGAAAESDEEEEEEDDDDEEEEFEMQPIMAGEKCSGGCNKKPRVTRVFCEDYLETEGKQHTLCVGCLERRDATSRLRETDDDEPGFMHCPIMRCTHRISMRELLAATRDAAPALHARFAERMREIAREARRERRRQQQQGQRLDAVAEEEEEEGGRHGEKVERLMQLANIFDRENPIDPAELQQVHQVQQQKQWQATPRPKARRYSATPLLDRRLLQATDEMPPSTPRNGRPAPKLSWTPRARAAGDAAAVGDEELPVTEEEAEELRDMAEFVDKEKLKKLEGHFPETALGWLVRHADYGLETLVEMVTNGRADPKMRERDDGRGATTIVKAMLSNRKQFECSVCFADYDEHLAIACVFMRKRRDTLQPGEAGPTAAEIAKDREEEARGKREIHKFCAECVIGHARAAQEQNVILRAGVGIKCMEPQCKNALLRAHIEQVLDMQTRAILDPLLSNEALLAANCADIEKCRRCSYAEVMEDKETEPTFKCKNDGCRHKHCRKCGRTYDKAHKGRTCEEMDPDAVRKRVEEQLTEQSMHKCPRCKRPIVKADGCNKIPCPCGQLSCYVCKAAIENYKHFKNGPADEHNKDKCPLWVDPTKKFEEQRQATLKEQINEAADEAVKEQLRRLK